MVLDKLKWLLLIQFSKDIEHGGLPLWLHTGALIFNSGLEYLWSCSLVWPQVGFNKDLAAQSIVLDCILKEVEENELVNSPVVPDGNFLLVLPLDYNSLATWVDLSLERRQHLLDLLLWVLLIKVVGLKLVLLDLYLLDLIGIVEE